MKILVQTNPDRRKHAHIHIQMLPEWNFRMALLLINSLSNGKILNWSKFKAFSDDKIDVA